MRTLQLWLIKKTAYITLNHAICKQFVSGQRVNTVRAASVKWSNVHDDNIAKTNIVLY